MLGSLLLFLFGFCVGGLTIFLGVAALIYVVYLKVEEKTSELRSRASLTTEQQTNNNALRRRLRSSDDAVAGSSSSPSSSSSSASSLRDNMEGYARFQEFVGQQLLSGRYAVDWSFIVLKGNMLFKFADKTSTIHSSEPGEVVCLDGCHVEATDSNFASRNTCLKISHEDRALWKEKHFFFLYFVNGKELEEWYYALRRAADLSDNFATYRDDDKRVHDYFSSLSRALLSNNDGNAWCNAILARFWWNIMDNKHFLKFIRKGLCHRITKMTDFPSFIDSMVLESMYIGSNVPHISNCTLHSISGHGEVKVDMDVTYNAGFEMKIKVNTSMQLPGASVEVPAYATMKVNSLSGRMRLHISPPPCERFWIGFHQEPQFEVSAETKIGEDTIMPGMMNLANNLMKKLDLSNIIVNKLKSAIVIEKMVLPNMDEWPLPYWPESASDDEDEMQPIEFFSRKEAKEQKRAQRERSFLRKSLIDISPKGITMFGSTIIAPSLPSSSSSSSSSSSAAASSSSMSIASSLSASSSASASAAASSKNGSNDDTTETSTSTTTAPTYPIRQRASSAPYVPAVQTSQLPSSSSSSSPSSPRFIDVTDVDSSPGVSLTHSDASPSSVAVSSTVSPIASPRSELSSLSAVTPTTSTSPLPPLPPNNNNINSSIAVGQTPTSPRSPPASPSSSPPVSPKKDSAVIPYPRSAPKQIPSAPSFSASYGQESTNRNNHSSNVARSASYAPSISPSPSPSSTSSYPSFSSLLSQVSPTKSGSSKKMSLFSSLKANLSNYSTSAAPPLPPHQQQATHSTTYRTPAPPPSSSSSSATRPLPAAPPSAASSSASYTPSAAASSSSSLRRSGGGIGATTNASSTSLSAPRAVVYTPQPKQST